MHLKKYTVCLQHIVGKSQRSIFLRITSKLLSEALLGRVAMPNILPAEPPGRKKIQEILRFQFTGFKNAAKHSDDSRKVLLLGKKKIICYIKAA